MPASSFDKVASAKNVVVYEREGHFCGWPANNGVWSWDDGEILVGFTMGTFKANAKSHSIDRDKPEIPVFARSKDGGETWSFEDHDFLSEKYAKVIPCPGGIDFTHPDFVMRNGGVGFFAGVEGFVFSNDRGRTWQGPYALPYPPPQEGVDHGWVLTPRTDYIVNGAKDCFFFLSVRKGDKFGTDRAFCARTVDGGKSIGFVSWINPEPHTVRGVMPSTVRCSETRLVSALRRKTKGKNWIDAFVSEDNGASWRFLSKVADTDTAEELHNGNPPSQVRLRDGRHCVTYGYRAKPWSIRAKISDDEGRIWKRSLILRQDASHSDIGYTRTIQRPDGKLVTIYYYVSKERPEQHIAATIWSPD